MSIKVIKPGLLTTIQDAGRTGFQKYGVIASGAMDTFAYKAANILVGNEESEAALEITILGPTLEFGAPLLLSICGTDFKPTLDGVAVPLWRPIVVKAGSVMRFGAASQGCRCYLAVAGGFDVPKVMESRSTYLRAGIGGFEGRALKPGDRLDVGPIGNLSRRMVDKLTASASASSTADKNTFVSVPWHISYEAMPRYDSNPVIRVVEGPQLELFDSKSLSDFFNTEFQVLPQSDRMGYRLQGATLKLETPQELISEAVTFGSIQVPHDGNPIVLMADRQTTGGYPKIAQIITVDLPLMAQVSFGRRVRFEPVSLREAQALYLIAEESLDALKKSIFIQFL